MANVALEADRPMLEINTTPLIDVMLVLLIMFIITIPIQTHSVTMDLPGGPPPRILLDPLKNKLVVAESGALLWNGQSVSKPELGRLLAASQRMAPLPELHLQPEAGARYELVDEVLAMTKRAAVAKVGFVGNDAYRAAF